MKRRKTPARAQVYIFRKGAPPRKATVPTLPIVDTDEPVTEVVTEVPLRLERSEVTRLAVLGHGHFEAGEYAEAEAIFGTLARAVEDDSFPHTMLGAVQLAYRRYEAALACFDRALAIDRKDLAALVYRGEVKLHQGHTRTAVRELEHALKVGEPDHPFMERARKLLQRTRGDKTPRRAKR